jgi:hypothetical protein
MTEQDHRMRPVDSGEPAGSERKSSAVSPAVLVAGLIVLSAVVIGLVWGTTAERTGTAANPPASTAGAGGSPAR